MTYFHPDDHHGEHPGTRYLIEFPGGESYICRYSTSYESENSGELDIEMDDPAGVGRG